MGLLQLVLLATPIGIWLLYKWLYRLRIEQLKGFPQPPISVFWGHLKLVGEYTAKGNPNRHSDYVFEDIHKLAGRPEVMALDMRPALGYPLLIINDHTIAEQIVKPSKLFKYSTPKSATMEAIQGLIGDTSIISNKGGEDWKALRKRFNPGFAPSHLITLLPQILSKTEMFTNRLTKLAESGEEFELEKLCTSLTFDIIAAVVLDHDFKAQLPEGQQDSLMTDYAALLKTYDSSEAMPVNRFRNRWGKQPRLIARVDSTLKVIIRTKFSEELAARAAGHPSKGRSVIQLSLQDITELTPDVLQTTADQVKSFLFAGHDTTSTTLQWAIYELSLSPRIRTALADELDHVLGPATDFASIATRLLSGKEDLLGRLTYTSAIIKETLRLYPAAASARRSLPGSGLTLRLSDGRDLCVDGWVLYVNHYSIMRDPKVYGESADEFMPERWLGDVDTSMEAEYGFEAEALPGKGEKESGRSVPPSAWRPFERGPRNCIGQELANLEARVILAAVARGFEFEKVGIGRVRCGEDGAPVVGPKGKYEVVEPMFNRRQVTSKPIDNMVVRVKLAKLHAEENQIKPCY
ncbi:cytochrome P450 [Trichodelitschia bisporula]|uniref:Cytochrome P450 n=1 Tax=Trichodelitschia bisporula TaxID=703511 RepID=A0A6G1HLB0_9PEZI|nr:cytochrome P450 [Trichodelitschia bisporula]